MRLVFGIKNPIFLHHYFVNVLKLGTWIFFFPINRMFPYRYTENKHNTKFENLLGLGRGRHCIFLCLSLPHMQSWQEYCYFLCTLNRNTEKCCTYDGLCEKIQESIIYKPISYIALHDFIYYGIFRIVSYS